MANYNSDYTGQEVDEAVGRVQGSAGQWDQAVTRLGQIETSIESMGEDIERAYTYIDGHFAKTDGLGLVDPSMSRVVYLDKIGSTSGLVTGDLYYLDGLIRSFGSTIASATPNSHIEYIDRSTSKHYRWNGSNLVEVAGQSVGSFINVNGGSTMRLWVGTQDDLNALHGIYEDDVVYVVATRVQGTVIEVTGVTVTSGTRNANTIPLTATINPSNATNKNVTWDCTNKTYFTISPNGLQASLIISQLATSAKEVKVTCMAANGIVGELNLSLAYEPVSSNVEIVGIELGEQSDNKIQCTAVLSPAGATDDITWNVVPSMFATINSQTGLLTILQSGQVTIKATGTNNTYEKKITLTKVDPVTPTGELDFTYNRTAPNTMTLAATNNGTSVNASFALSGTVPTVKKLQNGVLNDVPAVEISGNTLTYNDDCTVSVMATYGGNTQTKAITIAHNDSDYIWFEDDAVVAALNSAGIGTAGSVTYGQAASATKVQLINNADITRFNEFRLFTGITNLAYGGSTNRLDGNSNLLCVQLPSSINRITGNTATQSPLYGTAITDLYIPDGASLNAFALAGVTSLETLSIAPPDASGFVASSCISGCDNLRKVIVRNTTQSLPNAAFQNHSSIEEVDFGENISALPNSCFRGCTGLTKLTMRYNGFVSFSTSAFYQFSDTRLGTIDLYVPLSQVNTYKADANYAKFKSVNAITD